MELILHFQVNARRSHWTVASLCILGGALCALLWGTIWLQTRSEFAAQQRAIGQDLANLSLAVELSAIRVIEDADVALHALRTAFVDNGYRHYAADLTREAKRTNVHTTFLAAIDARGDLVASSKDWSRVTSTNFADRAYFTTHARSTEDNLYISKALRNRLDGEWRLFLSRRVSNWDGSFAGIVVVGLDPLSLSQTYRGIELGDASGVAIVGDDGLVKAGTGILSSEIGNGFKEGRRTGGFDNADGTGIIHESFAGLPRTLFYRRVGSYPLQVLVVAGGSRYAALSRDNSRRYQIAGGGLTALILVAVALAVMAHLRHEQTIRGMAFTDSLTGLANRAHFKSALETASARPDPSFTVLLLDLDGFKGVNDRYGHAVGDQVLIEVAERLRRATRTGDVVVRLGGDEFAVLCGSADASVEMEIGHRLCRSIAEPFEVQGGDVVLGVSVGIASSINDQPVAEILRRADVALYAAKAAGRGIAVRHEELIKLKAA